MNEAEIETEEKIKQLVKAGVIFWCWWHKFVVDKMSLSLTSANEISELFKLELVNRRQLQYVNLPYVSLEAYDWTLRFRQWGVY